MTSVSAKKKGTVIHRTTSETLRIGEELYSNQIRINQGSRKKSQATSPCCSFQITGILTRYDPGEESADDLDESHTDEISRVTDNETPSFSEDSRDDFQPYVQPQQISVTPEPVIPPIKEISEEKTVKNEETKSKSNIANNDLGRFQVVKVGSVVPFSRGRWTCYDYLEDSKPEQTTNSKTHCQPTFLYSGSIVMREFIPDMHSQRPTTTVPVSRVSCHQTTVIINPNLDVNQNRHTSVAPSTDQLDNSGNNFIGVPCQTIDNKIEHALDVVKSHLTHAVRLEVEELKVKINELVQRISYLEYENDLLRANVTPDVLATLHANVKRII